MGGSGGGGGGGGDITYYRTIEIVRGQEDNFELEVENKFTNTTLEDLSLNVTGFLSQYISISPSVISRIESKNSRNFAIKITIPAYKEDYEEYTLKAVITGIKNTNVVKSSYKETQNIKLIILERDSKESSSKLKEAEEAINLMERLGYHVNNVGKLLIEAYNKLKEKRNKAVLDFANEIIRIKNKAISVDKLIKDIQKALDDPKLINLITGNVPKEFRDEYGERVNLRSLVSGKAIFADSSIEEVLNLARVAFDRGDFDLAEERAQNARVMLLLERRGNLGLFFYLYWHFILLGLIVVSVISVLSIRRYQRITISKKIEDIDKEEDNIRGLIIETQEKYFSGKISEGSYNNSIDQHNKRVQKIKKNRITLRNQRVKLLKPVQISKDLETEKVQVEEEVKKIQTEHYVNSKLSKKAYDESFKLLNERLAEIEDEKTLLEVSDMKKDKSYRDISEEEFRMRELRNRNKEKEKEKIIEPSFEENLVKESALNKKPGRVRKIKFNIFNKTGSFFRGIKKRMIERINKVSKRIRKGDKRGIMMIDNDIVEILKREAKEKDYKGKWLELKMKEDENE